MHRTFTLALLALVAAEHASAQRITVTSGSTWDVARFSSYLGSFLGTNDCQASQICSVPPQFSVKLNSACYASVTSPLFNQTNAINSIVNHNPPVQVTSILAPGTQFCTAVTTTSSPGAAPTGTVAVVVESGFPMTMVIAIGGAVLLLVIVVVVVICYFRHRAQQKVMRDQMEVMLASGDDAARNLATPGPKVAVSPDAPISEVHRARLVRMYERYNKEKLASVNETLRMYHGDEERLFKLLVEKYGPEPPAGQSAAPVAAAGPAASTKAAETTTRFQPSETEQAAAEKPAATATEAASSSPAADEATPDATGDAGASVDTADDLHVE